MAATATPELRQLVAELPEKTLYFVETPDGFIDAVRCAVAEDGDELRMQRQKITKNNGWLNRVSEILAILR